MTAVGRNLLAWSTASRYLAVLLLLIGITAFFAIAEGAKFTSGDNIENLLASVSILWVVSMGMTFVVLTGGIDLSVGAMVALSGLVLAKLFAGLGVPALLAVVLTVLAGALIGGAVNGMLIGWAGLSFFVVTLGTASLFQGLVNIWSETKTTYIESTVVDGIGFGSALGVVTPIWIMLGVFLSSFALLRWTYFGRDVYAVGGNVDAAELVPLVGWFQSAPGLSTGGNPHRERLLPDVVAVSIRPRPLDRGKRGTQLPHGGPTDVSIRPRPLDRGKLSGP